MVEAQHRRGMFDFLYSIEEIGHYMIVAGYLFYLRPNPAILDVGCGQGRLFALLQATVNYRSYLGIDISPAAIRQAEQLRQDGNSAFEAADFEEWQPAGRFDAIVFNESIYYSERPREVLNRYGRYLNDDGALIVSIHEHFGYEQIWNRIAGDFHIKAGDRVENRRGQVWDVRLLQPRDERAPSR
jgi:2-polyprenyl-3-methyl-5-hydroxy-6-metoxy-1,4-benzoquinol methylase